MRKPSRLLALAALALPLVALAPDATGQAEPPVPAPWSTVVRITCDTGQGSFIGSGTVIISDEERAVILTASHVIDHPGTARVELFDGILAPPGSDHPSVNPVASFEGKKLGIARTTDVGLIEIRPGRQLAVSPIVAADYLPEPGQPAITVGCSNGDNPTPWSTRVVDAHVGAVNSDVPNYRGIACAHEPSHGRSGGGLFREDWALMGVCDFADPANQVGLYASSRSIHELIRVALERGKLDPSQRPRPACPPGQRCPAMPSPQSQEPPLLNPKSPSVPDPDAQNVLALPDLQDVPLNWTHLVTLVTGAGGAWLALRKPSGPQRLAA